MRDGYIEVNGLKADFRFKWHHPSASNICWVETAAGETWVNDTNLHWDNATQANPQVKCECHDKPCP